MCSLQSGQTELEIGISVCDHDKLLRFTSEGCQRAPNCTPGPERRRPVVRVIDPESEPRSVLEVPLDAFSHVARGQNHTAKTLISEVTHYMLEEGPAGDLTHWL